MKTLVVYSNVDGFAVQLKNHIEEALTELEIEWAECYIDDVVGASEAFEPTMHIFFHPNYSLYQHFQQIKDLKGHKLLWDMESPYESDLVFDALPHFYYVFTSDQNTATQLQKESTANHIVYVPHALNPNVHKPMQVPYEYKSDIAFIGNAYESRLQYFAEHKDEYTDKMVTIVGVGYRGLDGYQYQRVLHGHISEGEMVKYVNGTKFALNLHRINSDLDMANSREIVPDSYNNRYYEIAGTGKTQLITGRGEKHMFTPENLEEFRTKNSYKSRLVEHYLPILKK